MWILVALILGFLVLFQIAKATEYVAILKGEDKTRKDTNRINGFLLLVFLIGGLAGVWYCHEKLKDKVLPPPASNHGEQIDSMIFITLVITGIVFIITQIALFWFSFKYQERENKQAFFYPHNNRLEVIWTVVPALVLTVLVGFGLYYWFQINSDAPKDAIQVEVIGKQFNWEFRYPGRDGAFGKKYYKNVDETKANPLGQLWDDPANHDDIYTTGEMHIIVNRPVKLNIYAKDVLHDVGLGHFRMKMDAVPGIPTTMWFTPKFTTVEMRKKYGPDFNYEISCQELCGKGHYSMKGFVIVETEAEYKVWLASKKPQYVLAQQGAAGATQPNVDSTNAPPRKNATGVTGVTGATSMR